MKKIISLLLVMLMMLSAIPLSVSAASGEVRNAEQRDSIKDAIYVSNNTKNHKATKNESIPLKGLEKIDDISVFESDLVIVDFEELFSDKDFAKKVAEQIRNGKVFYIRAKGYSANRSIIAQTLGMRDSAGQIREDTNQSIINRAGTFGYMVFVNPDGTLQIVRQLVSSIDRQIPINEYNDIGSNTQYDDQLEDSEYIALTTEDVSFTFSDELDAIDSFLDTISPSKTTKHIEHEDTGLAVQSTFTSYTYEVLYDTQYYYITLKTSASETDEVKVGAVTRAMYAERLYYDSSALTDTSKVTSKWGYMVDMWMQPTWNQSTFFRARNYNLSVRFNTFPQGSSNSTYMMIFRDYTPTVDLSGETEATLSVGANAAYDDGVKLEGSAGFSVTTSFEDVEINVNKWQTGLSHSNNVAGWVFEIGHSFTRLTTNPVQTSTIKLPAGVVLWNYGSKASCVQLNFDAEWYINQGTFNFNDFVAVASGAVVWRPSNLS